MKVSQIYKKIEKVRHSWGESSEYCQDQIVDEIEPLINALILQTIKKAKKVPKR